RERFSSRIIWSTLAACRDNGGPGTRRRGTLGLAVRLDVTICVAASRRRSGNFVCAICGNARRCDRINHLFQHRPRDHARRDVVAAIDDRGLAQAEKWLAGVSDPGYNRMGYVLDLKNYRRRRKVLRFAGGK